VLHLKYWGQYNKITEDFETMSLAGTLPVSEDWSEKEIEEQKPVSIYTICTQPIFSTSRNQPCI
jgi:uncharacterized protein YecA (UPF0149 family)